ncbi:hydrogenase maturation protease [Mycobacterium paragordonae]|jgi:hydrogenase maturation protease|uniref:Hydrogenase maturation protease n=1 Tax=Mycobacterium paragordonae TaxID=1389713 RepID=A0A4R5WYR7_9MYCO|nr:MULTISPECIES: hydrogenase maturation protease [Mycobacterium]PJE23742.1 MAG: peptidase M52 [Mycobacterium sp.]MDP7735807.1 hydrogenase maturation protease [Mycobacterium paragordonae]OBJ80622.1 peptidase M52 [Mycobacterium gordonae]TDL01288.1 hydrogenase maturation protease [Mycobacterium paragordonae]TDL01670.1 hydrogenase maturation protease [Mycobacterium paragordonae]
MTARILVAGIGNIFLGDDGFGSEVARQLVVAAGTEIGCDDVRVVDYGIGGMHLAYDLLEEWDTLVLVDAIPSRGAPGALHVFQADHDSDCHATGLDAHSMDPQTVFASLRALGGTPPYTVIVGCEAGSVEEHLGLSEPVAAAVPRAVGAVQRLVAALLSSAPAEQEC